MAQDFLDESRGLEKMLKGKGWRFSSLLLITIGSLGYGDSSA